MSKISMRRKSLSGNESGLVAIMVTLIIMSLLTLVTIGFNRLMVREQRQAIDRQLGTQAFYAAESGINDAIKSGITLKDDCDVLPTADGSSTIDNNLSADDLVSYSCVTVDASGGDVVFDSISTSDSTTFPLNAPDLSSLQFSWQDVDDNNVFEDGSNLLRFPSLTAWGSDTTGVLRITIVPIPAAGFNRATMKSLARTYFLYPSVTAGGTVNYFAGGNITDGYSDVDTENSSGQVVSGQCADPALLGPRYCNVTVNGLNASGATAYYVRLKAIYRDVKVNLIGKNNLGNEIALPGAQYVIDSTGKANDVLKRIQVRVPIESAFSWPEYGLDSASSICKRLVVNATGSSNAGCIEQYPLNMNNPVLDGLD